MRPSYLEYIRSDMWKAKAALAKQRADYKCQVCNSGLRLNVHHRTYERLGNEAASDLTVLCRGCHESFERSLPEPSIVETPTIPTAEDQRMWELRDEWLGETGIVRAA